MLSFRDYIFKYYFFFLIKILFHMKTNFIEVLMWFFTIWQLFTIWQWYQLQRKQLILSYFKIFMVYIKGKINICEKYLWKQTRCWAHWALSTLRHCCCDTSQRATDARCFHKSHNSVGSLLLSLTPTTTLCKGTPESYDGLQSYSIHFLTQPLSQNCLSLFVVKHGLLLCFYT